MNWLVAGAAIPSLLVSFIACSVLRRVAARWNLVDRPGERKVHTTAVPYGGGLAIWAGVVTTLGLGQLFVELWARGEIQPASGLPDTWGSQLTSFIEPHLSGLLARSRDLWVFLAGGTVLVVLGWIDDVRKLDWKLRIGVEFLVASAIVFGQGWALTFYVDAPLLTGAVSVVWIVGLINSINMLDNMDGLAGGVSAIAATLLGIVMLITPEASSQQPQLFVAGFLFVLVGALVGFLFHNWPPARIFMGDAGSYFIGYSLAVMTILATFSGSGLPRHSILAPLCVLAVPLYDTLSVICIRLRAGRSVFEGDTNHFSHRLVALGLNKLQAVLTIYLTSAACGLGALLLHQVTPIGAMIIVLVNVCLLSVIAILEMSARRKLRT
jgi:UDP-GlcNAc:undecaprenyl-phosphate/decaprenyl-phosphate GlcNAc-1-phosphate transferase